MPSILGRGDVPLDTAVLDRLRVTMRHKPDFDGLLQEFINASQPLILQMERNQPVGGRPVELAAHTMKSMARLIGANALAEACRVVEFAAHGPRATPIPVHLVQEVSLQLRKAQEAVQRLLV